ncbi:MAG: hypothetical protein WDO56_19485 [Gammaproteobacteria bacterium]
MKSAATEIVVTHMNVAASAQPVWNSLMFYESVEGVPPLHLRLLLPRPIRTQGSKSNVGDHATCLYHGGHLLKRVTTIERNRRYEFTVVEQNLAVGIGVRLWGGCYSLRTLPDDRTELSITTHYSSSNRPRWLVRPVEAAVCHMFHRYLLGAIRRKAQAGIQLQAPETVPDRSSHSG